ncbi:hypothetical protein OIU84_003159, partial [Salix udensis]
MKYFSGSQMVNIVIGFRDSEKWG